MTSATVTLRSYRYHRRKPRIEMTADHIDLVLPGYFGRARWLVPMCEVAVCNLEALSPSEDGVLVFKTEEDSVLVFETEVVIPYLFTTGPVTEPNLLVLFRVAQRVPPLRAIVAWAPNVDLPFGYRDTRSENGAWVDGLLLRAVDSAGACDAALARGAELASDPAHWLATHRQVIDDPVERETALGRARFAVLQARVSTSFLYGSLLVAAYLNGQSHAPWWAWSLATLGVAVGLLLRWARPKPA